MSKGFKIVIATFVIVGLIFTTPFIMGSLVKKEFYNLISDLNSPNQFEIEVLEYQQGWFSSIANVKYTIHASSSEQELAKPFQFVIQEKIHHGPLILPSTFAQAVIDSKINDHQYPIAAKTIIHLDGKITTTLQAEKIANSIEHVEGLSFVLQHIDGNFELGQKQKDASGQLKLGVFDMVTKNAQLRVKNVNMDYSLSKSDYKLWSGNRSITVADFSLDTPESQQIMLSGFEFKFSNVIENERMHSTIQASLQSTKLDGKNYGTQDVEVSLSNLDAQSLANIQKHALEVQQLNVPAAVLFTQFYQLGMNLLSQGLIFDLSKFSLNTTWGLILAKAHLEIEKQPTTIYTPAQLADGIKATAYFQIPAKLLEKTVKDYYVNNTETSPTDQIQAWVDAGWIKLMGNNYRMKLKYEENKLFVNDKLIQMEQRS